MGSSHEVLGRYREQPIDEDLEARKIANLQARREPDLTRTSYTDNHANNGIVRIIGNVMTLCGIVVLFIAGSSRALAEFGIAFVYAYSGSETKAENAQILGDLPLHIARCHSARTCG